MNYLTYPICKKPICDASQKCSKRHNWVSFFWLVENYIHISYPKCDKVVKGSEIGKFGEEDDKLCIQKCNQCVIHLTPTYDPSITHLMIHLKSICNNVWPTCDLSMTYLQRFICNLSCDSSATHLWLICGLYKTHSWPIGNPSRDSYMTLCNDPYETYNPNL